MSANFYVFFLDLATNKLLQLPSKAHSVKHLHLVAVHQLLAVAVLPLVKLQNLHSHQIHHLLNQLAAVHLADFLRMFLLYIFDVLFNPTNFRFANKSGGFGALAQQATSSPQQQNSSFGGGNSNSSFGAKQNAFTTWRS